MDHSSYRSNDSRDAKAPGYEVASASYEAFGTDAAPRKMTAIERQLAAAKARTEAAEQRTPSLTTANQLPEARKLRAKARWRGWIVWVVLIVGVAVVLVDFEQPLGQWFNTALHVYEAQDPPVEPRAREKTAIGDSDHIATPTPVKETAQDDYQQAVALMEAAAQRVPALKDDPRYRALIERIDSAETAADEPDNGNALDPVDATGVSVERAPEPVAPLAHTTQTNIAENPATQKTTQPNNPTQPMAADKGGAGESGSAQVAAENINEKEPVGRIVVNSRVVDAPVAEADDLSSVPMIDEISVTVGKRIDNDFQQQDIGDTLMVQFSYRNFNIDPDSDSELQDETVLVAHLRRANSPVLLAQVPMTVYGDRGTKRFPIRAVAEEEQAAGNYRLDFIVNGKLLQSSDIALDAADK